MMVPLILTDLVAQLGFGHQVVLALSVGFAVWYAYRAMGFGRMVGGFVGKGLRYVMAVTTFVAVGIAFGWVNPFTMFADLQAGGVEVVSLAHRGGAMAWEFVMGLLGQ